MWSKSSVISSKNYAHYAYCDLPLHSNFSNHIQQLQQMLVNQRRVRFKHAVQTQANLCSRGCGFKVSDSDLQPMWHYISRRHGDTLSVVLCVSCLSRPSKKLKKHQMRKSAEASDRVCKNMYAWLHCLCVCGGFAFKNIADIVAVILA